MCINIVQYCYFESPIGRMLLAGNIDTLLLLELPQGKSSHTIKDAWEHNPHSFKNCIRQLGEYFTGKRKIFDINYVIQGTEFQQKVLQSVADIPYGTTRSYTAIAEQIKNPTAVRAVGLANARNPLPIIIPCHRVIGKNGTLTGYAGGIEAKRYLLNLEQQQSS